MCGIAGIIRLDGANVEPSHIQAMAASLSHRGPDDEGYFFVDTRTGQSVTVGGVDTPQEVFASNCIYSPKQHLRSLLSEEKHYDLALANRRLSIVDLSPAGHQPMCNENGTIWIVHNGEIYNFRELRRDLQERGHQFVSDTDTEVIIHAYEEWGRNCLNRFNGMWAFCIWDARNNKLFCSRDRFGIKPFYYYFDGKMFAFASEIKALLQLPFLPHEPNYKAVYDYLVMHSGDPSEGTFFNKIEKLGSREYLELDLHQKQFFVDRYWDIDLGNKAVSLSDEEYALKFHNLLEDSVRLRLISDVPVGTCLSGGLDSSTLVCIINTLLQKQNIRAFENGIQKTFSARYRDDRHDEGRFIKEIVEKTQVDPYYTFPTAKDLLSNLEDLVYYQEQPFGSTSIYAQWSVFRLARQSGVKVTLDGQGADELLAGYHHYFGDFFASLFMQLRWLRLLKEVYSYLSKHASGKGTIHGIGFMLPSNLQAGLKMKFQDRSLGLNRDFFEKRGQVTESCSLDTKTKVSGFNKVLYKSVFHSGLPSLLRFDDRNSMAHSIESRVPFLDHRLAEFAFSLPFSQKITDGVTKYVLRTAMKGVLPERVRSRIDKIGFSTPEDLWFRNELKDTITQILNSRSFAARPFFDANDARQQFALHCEGKKNISGYIWRWVNLELWLRRFID